MGDIVAGDDLNRRIAKALGYVACYMWDMVDHGGWSGKATWVKICECEKCYPAEDMPRYSTDRRWVGAMFEELLERSDIPIALIGNSGGYWCVRGYSLDEDETDLHETISLALCAAVVRYIEEG